jgi:neutral ceramidase
VRRRLLRALVVLLALLLVGWGWASVDRCGPWEPQSPALVGLGRGAGALRVGAAVVAVQPPYPVTVGGYGPPRSTAASSNGDVTARATVVEVGGQAVALVVVDTLLVTAAMRAALQKDAGLPLWLAATHTHSSLGGYDARLAVEVAALGRYRPDAEASVLEAAKAAVAKARARLMPARLEVATADATGLAVARSGTLVDHALTRVRFLGETGAIAQWLVLSAHPTLVPRRTDTLDPDWPGALAAAQELTGGGVTLVLQGAGGNASVNRAMAPTPLAFAATVTGRLDALDAGTAADTTELAWADVAFGLPRPDGSRLVLAPLRAAAENALCDDAERDEVLSALRLGPLTLVLVPVEPSAPAGQVLLEQAGASRVLSLVNGYAGYVELEASARAGEGESRRQYFDPGLLARLSDAARLAGQAVAPAP